jgi:branched-subunit amino acid ABC-type transport system permease component
MGVDINRGLAFTFIHRGSAGGGRRRDGRHLLRRAQYTMGSVLGLKAFARAVLGGIGNIPGPWSAGCCWA